MILVEVIREGIFIFVFDYVVFEGVIEVVEENNYEVFINEDFDDLEDK